MLKPSMYNISVDNSETGETALYNTLYGSLTLWSPEEIPVVRQVFSKPQHPAAAASQIANVLIEQKYLIDDTVSEREIVNERKRAGVIDKNRMDVILMPTQECNFACSYCYESHQPSRMSSAAENNINKWLESEIPKYKVTLFNWFGGEPLLEFRKVISITKNAAEIAGKTGSTLIRHMTTNGYLLDKSRIEALLSVGIHDFQITLDGPAETHDKLRCLKNGSGTFEQVFQNVVVLARSNEKIKISLRVNFNHSNLHSIPQLLEMFPADIRAQLRIVYEPIFGDCSLSASDNIPDKEISGAMADYYEMAKALGYDVVLGLSGLHTGKLVYCYAERANQYIINYNSDVFKCGVSEFKREERVGHIGHGGIFHMDKNSWDQWVNANYFEEICYACVYLPLCMGGCRKMRLSRQETGSNCALVPTNAAYLLKKLAFGSFDELLHFKGSDKNQ